MIYDFLVLGGGISGAFVSYFLRESGKSVVILDKKASLNEGASGVAGAFLSPMLGSQNSIKESVNSSLLFALEFYTKHTPQALTKNGILRICEEKKDLESAKKYEDTLESPFEFYDHPNDLLKSLKDNGFGGYFFKDGGILDTKTVLGFLTQHIEVVLSTTVKRVESKDGIFYTNGYQAKNIILAQGWEELIFEIPYLGIRKILGQRLELKAQNPPTLNIHKGISISCARKSTDTIAIGATNHREKIDTTISKEDTKILLEKSSALYDLGEVEVVGELSGIRSASSDYLPIVGALIDIKKTDELFPSAKNGYFQNDFRCIEQKNIYLINGLGARGFVYAPLCAKYLTEYIINRIEIPEHFSIKRIFKRWHKRFGKNYLKS